MIINADRFIGDWHENLKREIKWYINSIKAGCRARERRSPDLYRAARSVFLSDCSAAGHRYWWLDYLIRLQESRVTQCSPRCRGTRWLKAVLILIKTEKNKVEAARYRSCAPRIKYYTGSKVLSKILPSLNFTLDFVLMLYITLKKKKKERN